MTSAAQLPPLLMGHGPKADEQFQPRSLGMAHLKRTTFDRGANLRARVRFVIEECLLTRHATAWLDDLHNLSADFRGQGNMRSAWDLPRAAKYHDSARAYGHVAGLKIVRDGDHFHVLFYGPRGMAGGEPKRYDASARVTLAAAARANPSGAGWELEGNDKEAFRPLVQNVLPVVMSRLLRGSLAGQTTRDEEVREQWAAKLMPVPVHKAHA